MKSMIAALISCVITALLSVAGSAAYANPPVLTSIRAEPVAIGKNLVPDANFDSISAKGVPAGWDWSPRNTNATIRSVPDSHSGCCALRFTNGSSFGADVYGMLWKREPIALDPGHRYVLSAWTKSQDPGIAWVGGGRDWQYRLPLPGTGGKWSRVWLSFVASPEDRQFVLRCCTESPTAGVILDDVKLEEGAEPTPNLPEDPSRASMSVEPVDIATEVEGDGPFRTAFILVVPTPSALKLETWFTGASRVQSDVKLGTGAWRIVISGKSVAADDRPRSVLLRVVPSVGKPLQAEQAVTIYSASGGLNRATALRRVLPELRSLLEHARHRGQDISYPLVSYTVLDNFTRYAEEDIRKGQVRRGLEQLADLEPMAARCRKQLIASNTQAGRLPDVPRWNSDYRPKVERSSFLAPVRIGAGPVFDPERHGGTGAGRTRNGQPGSVSRTNPSAPRNGPLPRSHRAGLNSAPVFFTGYGAFGQVRLDIEKFPGYGVNIIQVEVGPSAIFPREGVVDEAPIREMKRVLERAQRAGVAVNLLISPHYFPEWMLDKFPYLRKRREGFLQYCLHAPEAKALLQRFVSTLLTPLKDYPALHSICLSNEPVNVEEPCEFALREW